MFTTYDPLMRPAFTPTPPDWDLLYITDRPDCEDFLPDSTE